MSEHHPLWSPSSGLPRALLCPGSPWLIQKLRAAGLLVEETNAAAEEGRLLHSRVRPDQPLEDLTGEQQAQVRRAREFLAEKTRGASEVLYEQPLALWIADEKEPVTWGRADVIARFPARIVVVDLKFGRAEPSEVFLGVQGSAYAIMAMGYYGLEAADVWIVHPRLGLQHEAKLSYDPSDPKDWRRCQRIVLDIIDFSKENRHFFKPGDQCQYCPALGFCDAAARVSSMALAVREPIESVPVERFARELELAHLAESWAEARKAKAKELIEAGARIPGWGVREVAGRREIEDPLAVAERLGEIMSQEDLLRSISFRLGELEKNYQAAFVRRFGGTKKAAGENLWSRLDGLVTRGDPVKQLVRVKE